MSNTPHDPRESLESDPVWDLLNHASAPQADAWFTGRVVREALQVAVRPQPWWSRLLAPIPAAALVAAAVAGVAGFFALRPPDQVIPQQLPAVANHTDPREENIAHIQEVLETEMLFVAVDHMDDFSDAELSALIGF